MISNDLKMLHKSFTHINLVARVLTCAHAITPIKWRRLLSTSFHPIIRTETFQLSDPGIAYQDDTIPQLPCHISGSSHNGEK